MPRFLTVLVLLLLACGCPQRGRPIPAPPAGVPSAATGPPVRIWADPALRHGLDGLEPHFRERYAEGWQLTYLERGEIQEILTGSHVPDRDPQHALASPPVGLLVPQALLIGDRRLADELRTGGFIEMPTLRTFAGDRVAVLQRADDTWPGMSIYELPMLRFQSLGAGGVGTSFGFYGQHVLASSGIEPRLEGRLRLYTSYEQMLADLQDGTLDMAMGLASSIAGLGLKPVVVAPEDLHEDVRYLAAAVRGSEREPGVVLLLRFLAEDPEVQLLLGGYGYVDRETALIEVQ